MASFAPPPQSKGPPMGAPPRGLPPEAIAARQQAMAGRGGPPMGGKGMPMRGQAPGAVNPYRNPKGLTPELLAQMARRRLGG